MKKVNALMTAALFLGGLTIASCNGEGGKKASPEDEVREFGKYFIEKLAANQLDSLAGMYEDIALADTILPIQSDTVVVSETGAGQYDVDLGEGVTLKLRREDDGKIVVTESRGLFSFPKDKIEIAKKTGMWNDSISDVVLFQRLKDEKFYEWLKTNIADKTANSLKLELGEKKQNKKWGPGDYDGQDELLTQSVQNVRILNNSATPISGNDYLITYGEKSDTSMDPDIKSAKTRQKTKKGVDIAANGSVEITLSTDYSMWDVEIVNPKVELKNKQKGDFNNFTYTGKEYQEYLDSKK